MWRIKEQFLTWKRWMKFYKRVRKKIFWTSLQQRIFWTRTSSPSMKSTTSLEISLSILNSLKFLRTVRFSMKSLGHTRFSTEIYQHSRNSLIQTTFKLDVYIHFYLIQTWLQCTTQIDSLNTVLSQTPEYTCSIKTRLTFSMLSSVKDTWSS